MPGVSYIVRKEVHIDLPAGVTVERRGLTRGKDIVVLDLRDARRLLYDLREALKAAGEDA